VSIVVASQLVKALELANIVENSEFNGAILLGADYRRRDKEGKEQFCVAAGTCKLLFCLLYFLKRKTCFRISWYVKDRLNAPFT